MNFLITDRTMYIDTLYRHISIVTMETGVCESQLRVTFSQIKGTCFIYGRHEQPLAAVLQRRLLFQRCSWKASRAISSRLEIQ
jgi:hypothetical protein